MAIHHQPGGGLFYCFPGGSNDLTSEEINATKSTVAECVKRLCLGCVDELLAAFLEFPGVDGEAG